MLKYHTKTNKFVATRQLVQLLCILYFEDVAERELDLLCECVMAGSLCDEAKESFIINSQTTASNWAVTLSRLSKKGILVERPHRTGKKLHPYFNDVIDIINGKKKNIILIQYNG